MGAMQGRDAGAWRVAARRLAGAGRGLRGRFHAAFLGLALVTGAVGALGSVLVERVGTQSAYVSQTVMPTLAETGILHESVSRIHAFVLDVTAGRGGSGMEARLSEMDALTARSLGRIARLMPGDDAMPDAMARARLRYGELRESVDGMLERIARVRADEKALGHALDATRSVLVRLQSRLTRGPAQGEQEAADASSRLRRLGLALDVGAFHDVAARLAGGVPGPAEERLLLERLADLDARLPALSSCVGSAAGCSEAAARLRELLTGRDGALSLRRRLGAASDEMEVARLDLERKEEAYVVAVDSIGDVARERMWLARAEGEALMAWSRWIAAGGLAAAFAITLAISVRFSRRVVVPVARMTEAMRALAGGDVSAEIPESRGRDEISGMAGALRVFRDDAIRRRELETREAETRALALLAEERQRAQEAVRLQNERFDAALNNMSQGLAVLDSEMRLVVCNARYAAMFGFPPGLVAAGTSLEDLMRHRIANGAAPAGASVEGLVAQAMRAGSEVQDLLDGRSMQLSRVAMPDGGSVVTYDDVTEARRATARIRQMAAHDALTGLLNRAGMREVLEERLSAVGPGRGVAIHCLDLDRFKAVNDTYGHPAGDALLREVAAGLARLAAPAAVARLGGDEFAVVQEFSDPAEADALAGAMVRLMSSPFEAAGRHVCVGASVGLAITARAGADADDLIRRADIALYAAKGAGRGRHAVFDVSMEKEIVERRALEEDLATALFDNTLELHYQPLVSFADGRVTGVEALLRWNHPVRGWVSPARFVPIAEESGMIGRIGTWAIRRACRDAAAWPDDIKVAVNLSPRQFSLEDDIVTVVTQALADTNLAPSRLCLEITESVLLDDNAGTLSTLHRLKRLGVTISLDDFGTGFSSLSYLMRFPFDRIKIDQSFVRDMLGSENCSVIVNTVIKLAGRIGMTTVAEGVETEEQYARLREEGCGEAQGYLISRARPGSEIPAIVEARSGRLLAA